MCNIANNHYMYDFRWGLVGILLEFYSINLFPVNLSIFPYAFSPHPLVSTHLMMWACVCGLLFICISSKYKWYISAPFLDQYYENQDAVACYHLFNSLCHHTDQIKPFLLYLQLRWETFQVEMNNSCTIPLNSISKF